MELENYNNPGATFGESPPKINAQRQHLFWWERFCFCPIAFAFFDRKMRCRWRSFSSSRLIFLVICRCLIMQHDDLRVVLLLVQAIGMREP